MGTFKLDNTRCHVKAYAPSLLPRQTNDNNPETCVSLLSLWSWHLSYRKDLLSPLCSTTYLQQVLTWYSCSYATATTARGCCVPVDGGKWGSGSTKNCCNSQEKDSKSGKPKTSHAGGFYHTGEKTDGEPYHRGNNWVSFFPACSPKTFLLFVFLLLIVMGDSVILRIWRRISWFGMHVVRAGGINTLGVGLLARMGDGVIFWRMISGIRMHVVRHVGDRTHLLQPCELWWDGGWKSSAWDSQRSKQRYTLSKLFENCDGSDSWMVNDCLTVIGCWSCHLDPGKISFLVVGVTTRILKRHKRAILPEYPIALSPRCTILRNHGSQADSPSAFRNQKVYLSQNTRKNDSLWFS